MPMTMRRTTSHLHGTPPVMGPETGNSREHDAGHRSAQGQMHDGLVGYSLAGKTEHQHRNDHQSPANTQKAGQNACNRPYGTIHCQNRYHISFLIFFRGSRSGCKTNLRAPTFAAPCRKRKRKASFLNFIENDDKFRYSCVRC